MTTIIEFGFYQNFIIFHLDEGLKSCPTDLYVLIFSINYSLNIQVNKYFPLVPQIEPFFNHNLTTNF